MILMTAKKKSYVTIVIFYEQHLTGSMFVLFRSRSDMSKKVVVRCRYIIFVREADVEWCTHVDMLD